MVFDPAHPFVLPEIVMRSIEDTIRDRKTTKVISSIDLPVNDISATVNQLLSLAGLAPFHRPCDESHRQSTPLDGIEPWRFHALDAATCRKLKHRIPLENAGKIPGMLAATDALILATWLPNPQPDLTATVAESQFTPTIANMEHVAATAAAVQNLLLAATALGIANYWSSGGVLRSDEVYHLLQIAPSEILLGAIFLFPSETHNADVVGSKLREHRCSPKQWFRWANLNS